MGEQQLKRSWRNFYEGVDWFQVGVSLWTRQFESIETVYVNQSEVLKAKILFKQVDWNGYWSVTL